MKSYTFFALFIVIIGFILPIILIDWANSDWAETTRGIFVFRWILADIFIWSVWGFIGSEGKKRLNNKVLYYLANFIVFITMFHLFILTPIGYVLGHFNNG